MCICSLNCSADQLCLEATYTDMLSQLCKNCVCVCVCLCVFERKERGGIDTCQLHVLASQESRSIPVQRYQPCIQTHLFNVHSFHVVAYSNKLCLNAYISIIY